ncbi:hypothetical protein [Flavobacterium sp.]|uniref:hypothetical protein n=1 Tax=Flavobacterium sp. TaxID=239 RepID=UPI003753A547
MKKIAVIFIVLISFSCKKEKYTTESLFLENLKETSSFYDEQIKQISAAINAKHQDYGFKSGEFDTLNTVTKKLDILFLDLKTKNKTEEIELQDRFVKEVNGMNSEYKIKSFTIEKLEVLDKETLYFYLKSEFYKNQFDNYTKYYSKLGIYCGYKIRSEKQQELINIIENSNIK